MKILSKTQSICPECLAVLEADYIEDSDKVYLQKKCEIHGTFRTIVSEKVRDYKEWNLHPVVNIPPKMAITEGTDGECPLHCGTCDKHLQTACCVLIDVTERCNQNCPYCFAKAGENDGNDVTLSEMEKKYDRLLDLGEERAFNIQISGGEPTVRNDLPEIIKMGKDKGFEYMQLNTNGKRIAVEDGYAESLKAAGTSVIFLQFDGTNNEIYHALRNEPLLETKKKAIENCRKAGLPVTLVPTVVKSVNLTNIGEMMEFMLANLDVVKGIHFQPVSFFGRHPGGSEDRVTMFDVMHALEEQTKGQFKYEDLCPISTGHNLCCFCGTFLKEQGGGVKSLLSKQTKSRGISCCDAEPSIEVIKRDRDFVLNKWDMSELPDEADGWDQILKYLKQNMFTVSGMAFQDAGNLDAERLKRCRVQVFTEDERLIPFCAYNSIYRGE